ncbi:MAG: DUF951 domain-containing protein [Dehalococcoidia bacterium]|jgi:hypothetical protein|nr:DUF951 domain-containing protein [Dehalococcoidia bacterium]MDP7085556.1 DUF951 domain-containing protein [Dehalococcoidia bacterium]MDP7202321.1 DUF951 domain-containing protein [Dehalococcoidia bacterium]MDP7511732.1 DUF951 domain-containing protein [Dehalococcoidia bacterium]HJN85536.1 DUF951 domain-containing protein [Dehalococcoidia bacterium]
MALKLKIGDVLRMKKAHPCGNHLWQVRRLGADIGITCQKCGRYVMLPRSYLERRVKEIVSGGRSSQVADELE